MSAAPGWPEARALLVAGSLVVAISFGIRHGFGLFLQPVTLDHGWPRETFAFAVAVQNLVWGLAQPIAGRLADRFGTTPVMLGGALFYAAGLALMAAPFGASGFVLAQGLLVGLGLAGTTFPIVFGAVGRAVPAEKRSLAFGIVMAVGSIGQFVLLPLELLLIETLGWANALLVLAALALLMLPLAWSLRHTGETTSRHAAPGPGGAAVLRAALGQRDFRLLALGFFVCGFQVVFVATHLPAFLAERGVGAGTASLVLAIVGLVNVAGTLGAGWLGGRWPKPRLLVWIYLLRALVIALFVALPVSPLSTLLFGAALGLLWLSTVPPTNGIVATLFGTRDLAMLGGVVFLAHQLGSFLGGWLGGLIHDRTGSYDLAWAVAVALGLLAAVVNLPIRERPVVAPAAVSRG